MAGGRLESFFTPLNRLTTERPYAVLALLALLFFLPGFFALPPVDRDEARFAQASRQMLESGDFVDIRFQDQPRHKKPAGIYWLQAASAGLFGGGPEAEVWAFRVPSLAGAVLAVLLTFWAGRRLVEPQAAFAGAVMLAACVMLGVEARSAKTDAMLLACVVLAQGALARVYLGSRDGGDPPGLGIALLFWAAQGVGILIKGPIVLLVSGTTILALSLLERRLGWLRALRPLPGLALMLVIVTPWLAAISIATDGAFFREAIGHDLLGKVAKGQESHGAPPGVYLATIWATFWPFSLLAGLAVPWVWRHRREPAVRFCLAWLLPTWLILELVPTKLPHYVLPTVPAIALLAAMAGRELWTGAREATRHWARFVPLALFVVVALIFTAAMPAVSWYLQGSPNPWSIPAALGGLVALVLGVLHVQRRWPRNPVAPLALAALLLYAPAYQGVVPALEAIWLSPRVAEAIAEQRPCETSVLAAAGYTEPSMVFLVGTETKLGGGDMVAQHLLDDPACSVGLISGNKASAAFNAVLKAAGREVVLLASVPGINYSRGDLVDLKIYRLDHDDLGSRRSETVTAIRAHASLGDAGVEPAPAVPQSASGD